MSISQLDPSLLSSQPLNQSPGTPNLADLSLGSEFSGISMGRTRSEADPNRANEKPKRTRRTKAQMAAYWADLERSKKLTDVEKITEGAKRGHKGRCGRSSQRGRGTKGSLPPSTDYSCPEGTTIIRGTSTRPLISYQANEPAVVLADVPELVSDPGPTEQASNLNEDEKSESDRQSEMEDDRLYCIEDNRPRKYPS
ncbi:hypothetical protein PtA15_1A182 [Puccinia triticina]|uniref:Uncharacterized protein n=1 Tax=Puccinia triticina TaxID=208348 RepID=A0ABY7C813_9BASI|nr:uncharacterized protein PtA15_1A182 [Puccinia triticina]WAQ80844.1 hypothetical protein PtA15_1A182 [Puccinia triticina]